MSSEERSAWIMLVSGLGGYWTYLAFVLSAVLASVAKLIAYRRGLPAW